MFWLSFSKRNWKYWTCFKKQRKTSYCHFGWFKSIFKNYGHRPPNCVGHRPPNCIGHQPTSPISLRHSPMLEFGGRHASVKGIAAAQNLTLGLSRVQALGKPSQGRFASLRATVENVKSYIYTLNIWGPWGQKPSQGKKQQNANWSTTLVFSEASTGGSISQKTNCFLAFSVFAHLHVYHWENYMFKSDLVLLER